MSLQASVSILSFLRLVNILCLIIEFLKSTSIICKLLIMHDTETNESENCDDLSSERSKCLHKCPSSPEDRLGLYILNDAHVGKAILSINLIVNNDLVSWVIIDLIYVSCCVEVYIIFVIPKWAEPVNNWNKIFPVLPSVKIDSLLDSWCRIWLACWRNQHSGEPVGEIWLCFF